tara:strand:- start:1918 stop:2301 length:384 start_codon:yes stop_codon:yes gene_type:complete
MATNANWTVVFDDKLIINQNLKNEEGFGTAYTIDNDDSFWNDSKFSNIWAIQYGTSISSDEVEYRDTTPHSTFADADVGSFDDFINKWDAAHLVQLQSNWDNNNEDGETEAEKITRLGARPTEYSSL